MLPALLSLLLVCSQAGSTPPGQAAPRAGVLAETDELLRQGALDAALQRLEAAVAAEPQDAELERALARALELFVDGGGSWLALTDARAAWDRALALEPDRLETQRGAIAVRLRLGENEAALALAERALGSAWLSGGQAPAVLLELACRARLAALPAVGTLAPEARKAALIRAWAALEHARGLAGESDELVRLTARLLESEGLSARAAAELEAALARRPAATELHRALIDLYRREGLEGRLSALYERWSAAGTNATLAWFTGYAWRLSGDLAQRERRFREGLEAYERAAQWMGVAATLEPRYRATAESVAFQTQVSAGWCELESENREAASERLLTLLRTQLARRDEPDGLGRTVLHALAALGERRVADGQYQQAAAEARAVTTLLPADGAWWNNLGFLLREHATQLAAGLIPDVREPEVRAREVFAQSWQAYRRAAELLGDDPRVLNDAALVQVYHLRDHLAEAEELLERARTLAQARLLALGPEPDERQRFPLAQAYGDASLNLGYLCYHVYRQPARARAAFVQALASDSGERPELAAYLAAIDGQRGPVSEPDRAAFVAAPRSAPRVRATPAWEASLGDARERARVEGRALLVYRRGAGLGLEVEAWDERVTSPEFVRQSAALVLLVADEERRTFCDRRQDGRRVACPRFGALTCAEHQRVAAEVDAWLGAALGLVPGESEEGLWLLRPGAEQPERVRELAVLAEFSAQDGERGAGPFEALEASLGGEDGGGEARALVGTRSLTARLACERILWEGFRSSPARGHLLAALAEDPSAGAAELLAACVRAGGDAELQRAALAVWPPGRGLDAVRHAWHWAPGAEVRAAAEAVLRRELPGDPLWSACEVLGAR